MNLCSALSETIVIYLYLFGFVFSYYIGKAAFAGEIFGSNGSNVRNSEKYFRYIICLVVSFLLCWILDTLFQSEKTNYENIFKYFLIFTPAALFGVYKRIKEDVKFHKNNK